MAKLGQNGVEHDAAERIILDAEHAKGGDRLGIAAVLRLAALARSCRIQRHRQCESGTATATRCDRDVAAHRTRQLLDRGKPQAGAAEARGDGDIGLGERAEQPLDLGHGEADAAVGHLEGDADPAFALRSTFTGTPWRDGERHAALVGEFHRVVDQVLERGAQADGITDHKSGKLFGDINLGLETLGSGAAGQRIAGAAGERPEVEQVLPQCAAALAGPLASPGGIDEQRGKARQMLGTGLDGVGPAPLSFPEI